MLINSPVTLALRSSEFISEFAMSYCNFSYCSTPRPVFTFLITLLLRLYNLLIDSRHKLQLFNIDLLLIELLTLFGQLLIKFLRVIKGIFKLLWLFGLLVFCSFKFFLDLFYLWLDFIYHNCFLSELLFEVPDFRIDKFFWDLLIIFYIIDKFKFIVVFRKIRRLFILFSHVFVILVWTRRVYLTSWNLRAITKIFFKRLFSDIRFILWHF